MLVAVDMVRRAVHHRFEPVELTIDLCADLVHWQPPAESHLDNFGKRGKLSIRRELRHRRERPPEGEIEMQADVRVSAAARQL